MTEETKKQALQELGLARDSIEKWGIAFDMERLALLNWLIKSECDINQAIKVLREIKPEIPIDTPPVKR